MNYGRSNKCTDCAKDVISDDMALKQGQDGNTQEICRISV